MKKLIIAILSLIAVLIGTTTTSAFATTETIFNENFDGTLTGWNQILCNTNHPTQICSLVQDAFIPNPHNPEKAPAPSSPYWGSVRLQAFGEGSLTPIEVRYQKSFSVTTDGDYDVSAVLGVTDCSSCIETAELFIDGNLIFSESGVDVSVSAPSSPTTFPKSTTLNLTTGPHTVEINLYSTGAISGEFRASFDDISINRELPPDTSINSAVVGKTSVPIINGGTTSETNITFSFSSTGGVGAINFECKLDLAAFSSCSSPISFSKLKAGIHIFDVRAVDSTSKTDPSPAHFEWIIKKGKIK